MFVNERFVGTALCVSGLLLAIGALVWLLHDDEKQRHRLGIAPEEWERGRETVRKSMGDPYERLQSAITEKPEWLRRLEKKWRKAA